MSDGTKIEWTDASWGVVRGCSMVSDGCKKCYAMKMAHRFSGPGKPFEGLTVLGKHGPHWTGEARMIPKALSIPLRWRKPRRVFVCSASDLFHEDVPFDYIAAVFGVMAAAPQHSFQVLTKRPKRMLEWFQWVATCGNQIGGLVGETPPPGASPEASVCAMKAGVDVLGPDRYVHVCEATGWPLPNVWIGVSCENQEAADKRLPLLLQCPAAVHWVSAEPLLGPLDITRYLQRMVVQPGEALTDSMVDAGWSHPLGDGDHPGLDWIVVGGESGPGARACDVGWVGRVVDQCAEADVPVFVKQLGANPVHSSGWALRNVLHSKGGDMSEWPSVLRVRQMPAGGA